MAQQTLLGRYVLRREVGVGAYGRVLEAFDLETQRTVAIKALIRLEPTALHRFKQEFRGFADVVHPNLVGLHALFVEDGAWYLVMDFVDGPDLGAALGTIRSTESTSDGAVDATVDGDELPIAGSSVPRTPDRGPSAERLATLRPWFGQLASGVAALHAHGRIHRDLKPSNILVERATDRVVVVDFGLGLIATGLAAVGARLNEGGLRGTPAYMAPEQTRGEPLSSAADMYALGVLLYEALTGVLPFTGNAAEMMEGHRHLAPRDPADLVSVIPDDLRTLCLQLLSKSPAARPSAEACAAVFGAPNGAIVTPATMEPPFVGRTAALDALEAARRCVRDNVPRRPQVVRLDAPPGLGKSALLRAWSDGLPDDVVRLHGRCNEAESVPFKALDALVDDLCQWWLRAPASRTAGLVPQNAGALATLFPVLRRLPAFSAAAAAEAAAPAHNDGPQGQRRRAFSAFRELLTGLTRGSGLVLLLDDVQWGDTDGAALLGDALSGDDAPALLVVVACRTDELSCPFLARLGELELAKEPSLRHVTLPPLSSHEAALLATAATAPLAPAQLALAHLSMATVVTLTPAQRDRMVGDAAGNPLFMLELAWQARQGHSPQLISLEGVLTARIDALPGRVRRVLEAVALGGWPKSAALVGQLAAVPPGEVHEALRRLRSQRLVRARRGAGNALECAHDRIGDVVERSLPAEEARTLHRRAASLLMASAAPDVEALAHHWRAAGDLAEAARWAEQAAEHAAQTLAFDRAAAHLGHALEGASAEMRPRLLRRRAELLVLAGRDGDAAAAWRDALAQADVASRPDVERQLATHLLRTGLVDEGLVAIAPVLARAGLPMPRSTAAAIATIVAEDVRLRVGRMPGPAVGAALDPALLARVDACWAAGQGLVNVDMLRGFGFLLKHLRLALTLREPTRMVRGLGIAAMLVSSSGGAGLARAEKLLAHARSLRPHLREPADALWIEVGHGMTALARFDWETSKAAFQRALSLAGGDGLGWELGTCRYFSTLLAQTTGDLPTVMATVPMWTQDAADRGDRYTETMFDTAFGAYCDLCADAPERAEARLTRAMARWSDRAFLFQHANALYLRADALAYQGRTMEAYELISKGLVAAKKAGLFRVEILALRIGEQHGRRAADAVLAGQSALRPIALSQIATLQRRHAPWTDGFAHALRATLAMADSDRAAAAAHFEAAASSFALAGAGLHETLARFQVARVRADVPARATHEATLRTLGLASPTRFAAAIMPALPAE